MRTEDHLKATVSQRIASALKELLERKHLYQNIIISTEGLAELIQAGVESYKNDIQRAEPNQNSQSLNLAAQVMAISDLHNKRLDVLLYGCWDFYPELHGYPGADPINLHGAATDLILLPSARLSCNSKECKGTVQPHNSGYPHFQGGIGSNNLINGSPTVQIFSFPYQCQNCKEMPLIFLVKRDGLKLTLVGRSELPRILAPGFIPTAHRKLYEKAIISDQTGFILAAILYLRTVIEQYFHQVIPKDKILAIQGNPTGDELGDLYAKTLPPNFPATFPSLKKAYRDLSEIIHAGKETDEVKRLFAVILAAVDGHFKAVQVFREMPPQ